ncbi:MAG: type II toxin-antitoxin system Phd/YefM family antitoxin [Actinomycetota bacterium]
MTSVMDLEEAQSRLRELLIEVAGGAEVILTDGSMPLARLVPLNAPLSQRVAGLHPGAMQMSDDFDEPLPDEFWLGVDGSDAPPA